MNVSVFKNAKSPVPTGSMEFTAYISGIRDGLWQDEILNYRAGKRDKTSLTAITPSGTFKDSRANKNLSDHSGFINIDVDQKENELNLLEFRETLYTDEYIYAGHTSAGGNGLSLYIRITPDKHYESFLCLEKYFANKYHIIIDTACKDVSRLRFVSFDPELYLNMKAKKWTETAKKEEVRQMLTTYTHDGEDVDFVIDQIKAGNVDLAPSYHDWMRLGFAIADKYAEGGRQIFHLLSQYNSKYNSEQTDKQYTNCLNHKGRGVTMNFFFYLAKTAGLKLATPRTKKIVVAAKISKKLVGKSGGYTSVEEAKLKTINSLQAAGITPEISAPIIDQAFKQEDKRTESKDELLNQVFAYIDGLNIRYNEVTQRLEMNGRDLTDLTLNSIYINIISIFGDDVKKQLIFDYIYSDRTSKYNPFLEFFARHAHLKPEGNIAKLIGSIKGSVRNVEGSTWKSYNDYFIEKWLLSVVASAHGTYSLLILVLSGKQISGKTKWLRGLLPDELRRYYAESKLDEGKDDQINMCTHLILCDDEYGGKSKTEAKKLKDLSSKQTFTIRRPYGRTSEDMIRYAVLCGTTNENEIINDITGNRRVIPVNVESVDFEVYDSIDKTELWIELYHIWQEYGNDWMLTADDIKILNEHNSEFTESSTEAELLFEHYYSSDTKSQEKYTSTEIRHYLEMKSGIKNISQRRLGIEMKKMGYKNTLLRAGNQVMRCWSIAKKSNNGMDTPF